MAHSQGCLILFLLLMQKTEYVNKRIKKLVGLAPALYMNNI